MKKKKILISCLVAIIFIVISVSPAASINITKISNDNSLFNSSNDVNGDIKARTSGGSWQDSSLTADTGSQIEFKLEISSPGGGILITVVFPTINDESMFNYVIGSASHIPFHNDGVSIMWGFASDTPDTIVFKAKVVKKGTGDVQSIVCDIPNDEYDDDSIRITGQGGCCFVAGTKISMADGTCKNIEDVRLGDRVLSYDIETGKFNSWIVKLLGRPKHPVYNINDGLMQVTLDHPIFIKKADGRKGIGAINIDRCIKSSVFEENILSLEIDDYLFSEKGEWIKVTNIESSNNYVQTYNILSYIGTRTFFANGILVYEEHPKDSYISSFLENVLESFPRITQFILSRPIVNKMFTP